MWEHRTVSNKEYQTTGRMTQNETYVRLMDIRRTVKKAEVERLLTGIHGFYPEEAHGKNFQLTCLKRIRDKIHRPLQRYSTQTIFRFNMD